MKNITLRTMALVMALLLCLNSCAFAETVDSVEELPEIIISEEPVTETEETSAEQAEIMVVTEEAALPETETDSEEETVQSASESETVTEEALQPTAEPSEPQKEEQSESEESGETLPEETVLPEDAEPVTIEESSEEAEQAVEPQPVEKIEFVDQIGSATLTPGETHQIQMLVYPLDQPHDVRFRSIHPGLASVDEGGLITAITGGKTDIIIYDNSAEGSNRILAYFGVRIDSDDECFESTSINLVLGTYTGPGGHVVVPEGFETIGKAFYMNQNITAITLPDTVKAISGEAFYGCTNLETIRFSSNLESIGNAAFVNCGSLGEVSFPNGLKGIGDDAFSCCPNLTFDSLPESIETIGEDAFSSNKKLERVVLPGKLKIVESGLFAYSTNLTEVVLPEGVTRIDSSAFNQCTKLEKINLPDGITSIGMNAFKETNVSFETLPSCLETIGMSAFEGCENLTNLVIPEGVTSIDAYAFRNCGNLETLKLPSSISYFNTFPFEGCSKLTLRVPKNSYAHIYCEENGLNYELDGEMIIFHVEDGVLVHYYGQGGEVVIPDGVERIADGVFKDNTAITGVVFPASLKEIGNEAFYKCINLNDPIFPEGLEIIGESAFYGCSSLRKISIPSTVKKIGKSAFEYYSGTINSIELLGGGEVGEKAFFCHGADRIEIHGNVKSIGANAFTGIVDTNYEAILHEGVETIGEQAFGNMAKITLPASVTSIADNAFTVKYDTVVRVVAGSYAQQYCMEKGISYTFHGEYSEEQAFIIQDGVLVEYVGTAESVVIPEAVSIIGKEAFQRNENLRAVYMNAGVTEIQDSAFFGCSNLESIVLPDSLVRMGNYVFAECTSLKEIVLPDSMIDMGIDSFRNCTSLKSAWIGANISHVGGFKECTSLESVHIPKGAKSISEWAFYNCPKLNEIDLSEGLESIGYRAFYGCASLTSVDLPASVKFMSGEIFANCIALKSVKIPAKCTCIYSGMFENCTGLVSVYISSGVREISDEAFNGCTALKSVHVPSSVRTFGKNVFGSCPNLTVYCSSGSKAWNYCKAEGVTRAKPGSVKNALQFDESSITIGVGQTCKPVLKVNEDYALGSIRFSSSSTRVVSVDKNTGEITGKKTGTATITAASESGVKTTVKVTVKKAPSSVSFAESEIVMGFGESIVLEYTLSEKSAGSVQFAATNESVLRVEEDGRITAIGAGKDTVTITTYNDKTDTCEVTVLPPPEQLYLDKYEITVRQNLTAQLSPYVNEGSLCRRYDFVSSDPTVIEVDEAGKLRGVSMGTAQITVGVPGVPELRQVCVVTVIEPPTKVVLAAETITLGVNEKFDLAPQLDTGDACTFTCVSSKTKYVTVSDEGIVTAKRVGSAMVEVTAENGLMTVCQVIVKKAPSSVKLSASTIKMGVDQHLQLAWTLSSRSAASVSFASSDTAVAEVTPSGEIIAKAIGTATISIQTYNGRKASAKLTVYPEPENISFEYAGNVMHFGVEETGTLTAKLNEGSYGSYTFASSNEDVLIVDEKSGKFSAVKEGKCTVTVTAYNGVDQIRDVIVCGKPVGLKFEASSITIGVGQKSSLSIYCWEDGDVPCGSNIRFKSSRAKTVSVNADGEIVGLRTGSATITATTYNGRTAKIKITVKRAPTQLTLNAEELYLGYGETFRLKSKLSPSSCYSGVQYESSDPSAVTVSVDGNVTVNRSEGSATITATTYNGLTDSCVIHLGPDPTYISFPQETLELYAGMRYPMELQTDGVFTGYTTQSGNSRVAYVDDTGNIVAKRAGTTEIVVTAYNGEQAKLQVTVKAAPSKYKLTLPGTLEVGTTYNLLDYYVSTPVSDPSLTFGSATVSNKRAKIEVTEDGVFLTVVEAGSFTLTVKSYNGKTARKTYKAAAVQY